MYLNNEGRTYYSRTGNQHHSRAPFLILMQDKDGDCGPDNFRAIVRKVALEQLGHFMMGTARIKNTSITISGAYGSDGLPVSVPKEIYDMGIDIPAKLYEAWNKGGGWNSCGNEAEAMKEWDLETFGV